MRPKQLSDKYTVIDGYPQFRGYPILFPFYTIGKKKSFFPNDHNEEI